MACRFEGCRRTSRWGGLCDAHARQRKRRGEGGLTPLGERGRAKPGGPVDDPWTPRDEACYRSAAREVAGVFGRRVAAEVAAGECRAEAERGFRDEFPLLASLLPPDAAEGAPR